MKNIFILTLCIMASCAHPSENFYGEKIDNTGVVTLAEAKATMSEDKALNVKLSGEILETCSNKGCWMTMKMDDGQEMRVTFKDYGFFVPKEGVQGKLAIIQGEAVKEITDVETLQHYAEDAGKSESEIAAITEPKEEYNFVASGVIIVD